VPVVVVHRVSAPGVVVLEPVGVAVEGEDGVGGEVRSRRAVVTVVLPGFLFQARRLCCWSRWWGLRWRWEMTWNRAEAASEGSGR